MLPEVNYMVDTTVLLAAHGHHRLNDFRTIQQAWGRLNSTPYDVGKAAQYAKLRDIMLEHEEDKTK